MSALHLTFDRGTIRLAGATALVTDLAGVTWDDRTSCHRAPAHQLDALMRAARDRGVALGGPAAVRREARALVRIPPLRSYQSDAFGAWRAFGRRGVIALPTGAGKTRVAIAAMADAGCATAILAPTCALVEQWRRELATWTDLPIGVLGDGEARVEPITVMTFESAYRRMDELGDRFGLLVADEAHHFGTGFRAEALEASIAPYRLGLTATPPERGSEASARLGQLLGPVVYEIGVAQLTGAHLAPFELVTLTCELDADERAAFTEARGPFLVAARAFRRLHGPGGTWNDLVSHLSKTREGRAAVAGFRRSRAMLSMPRAKRARIEQLLDDDDGQQRQRRATPLSVLRDRDRAR